MTRKTHTFHTKKVANGFHAVVTESTIRDTPNANGSFADTVVLHEHTFTTRARATGWAKKWVRYLRFHEKEAA